MNLMLSKNLEKEKENWVSHIFILNSCLVVHLISLKQSTKKNIGFPGTVSVHHISPNEVEITDATNTDKSASFLDLIFEIDSRGSGWLSRPSFRYSFICCVFVLCCLRSSPRLGWSIWNICVTNDHEYCPLVVSASWAFPLSRFNTGIVTRLTRRMPHVRFL